MPKSRALALVASAAIVAVAGSFGLGLAMPAAPDVGGLRAPDAEARLLAGGLRPGLISGVAPTPGGPTYGRVVWQSVAPGTRVPMLTAVDLRIVAYPVIYDLPDLTGWWVSDIRSLLASEAVPATVTCVDPRFRVFDGIVASTTPPPGPIVRADGVTLTVTTLHGFRITDIESPLLHEAWSGAHAAYVRHYGSDGPEPCSGCHTDDACGDKPGCHTPL